MLMPGANTSTQGPRSLKGATSSMYWGLSDREAPTVTAKADEAGHWSQALAASLPAATKGSTPACSSARMCRLLSELCPDEPSEKVATPGTLPGLALVKLT